MDESLQIEPEKTAIGALLKAEREKQKLSRKQVAEVLNLSESMISALENDQESHSIPPTYVRGYQRAYVRLLRIEESEVLDDLSHVSAIERPHQDLHYFDKNLMLSKKSNSSLKMLTKVAAVILLFAIAFLNWPKITSFLSLNDEEQISGNSSQFEAEVITNEGVAEQKIVILNAAPVADSSTENVVEISDSQEIDQAVAESENNSGITTEIINLANNLDQSEQLDNVAAEIDENAIQSDNQIESKISELLLPRKQTSDVDLPLDGEQQDVLASVNEQETQATITFVSNGESWLSIADAQENNLYRNTLKLDRVTVTGDLPLFVRTGNVGVLRVLAEKGEQQKVGIYDDSRTVAKFFVDVDVQGRLKFTPQ